MSERFDPTKHLIDLKGKKYLQVMHRLVWVREVHPDAQIETELVNLSPEIAVFKARVTLPSGGSATGYGSETPRDFGDYIEKAETKSIGRALAAAGFGTQFSGLEFGGEHESGRLADSPVASPDGPRATAPTRNRSTTVNTVPAADPDTGEIIGWTQFWDKVEAMGFPRDGKAFVAMTGIQIGSDPALALEKTLAWAHDNPVQAAAL